MPRIITIIISFAYALLERIAMFCGLNLEGREREKDGDKNELHGMPFEAKIAVFSGKTGVSACINYWDNIANYTPVFDVIEYVYRMSDDRFKSFFNLESPISLPNTIKVCPVSLESKKNWTRLTCDFVKLN